MNLMRMPQSIDIDITNSCNLRCVYCAHFTSAGDVDRDLPAEEWIKFFEELNCSSVMSVCLQGGEPFMRKDILELLEGIVKNRMRFSILSNGSLVTDEIAVFVASTGRYDSVQISIDGAVPYTHDIFRGEGSFSKAMEGIRNLKKHGIRVTVRVTIHKNNVYQLERIAELLLDDLKLHSFSTNSASFKGLCRENTEKVQLSVQEYAFAMKSLVELNKKYNGRIHGLAGPLASTRIWSKMEEAYRNGEDTLLSGGYLAGCNGFATKLGVRADGIIIPCLLLSHIELGRINQDSLIKIWQDHPEMKRLRARRQIPLDDLEFCRGCDYIRYCAGGCPGISYSSVGSEYHSSPDSCYKRFLEEGGRLPDAAVQVSA